MIFVTCCGSDVTGGGGGADGTRAHVRSGRRGWCCPKVQTRFPTAVFVPISSSPSLLAISFLTVLPLRGYSSSISFVGSGFSKSIEVLVLVVDSCGKTTRLFI